MAGLLGAALLLSACHAAPADTAADTSGAPLAHGDYYLFALSWSPEYCAAHPAPHSEAQCITRQALVVHGLWPQHEAGGWPEFCGLGPELPPAALVETLHDLMPSASLARHQWRKHGRCDTAQPEAYFAQMRRARQRIELPALLHHAEQERATDPRALRHALQAVNPDLPAEGIALHCRDGQLREIWICLDPSLEFRACGAGVRDRCTGRIVVRAAAAP